MSVTSYRTVARDGWAEIEVDRSRFRCTLTRVADESDARAVVERARREHWDARHHCHAFVVGEAGRTAHCGDDGEPPGTAGAPMLQVLQGHEDEGLRDVVAVVSRWFGGRLLGTGGLVRAYSGAVRAAVEEVGTVRRVLQDLCEVTVDISAVGRLEHDLRARGARVLGVEYLGDASLRFAVPPATRSVVEEIVAELTGGAAAPTTLGQEWVDA